MGEDEAATVRTVTVYRQVMATLIQKHRGEIQEELKARNAELPENRKMEFRIGINLGDVIVEGERIYGDGVNVAARVEKLSEGGGICISGTVYDQIENKLALGYEYLGEQAVKNIKKPVRVYRVLMEPKAAGSLVYREKRTDLRHRRRAYLALVGIVIAGAIALAIWNQYLRPTAPPAVVPPEQTAAIELPDKPSIAVLPFVNMSGDPEQEYFSDGITEDLITDLSKVSGLFVIARNSVYNYKGKAIKPEKVSQELGVRYVLEGSVRKSGDRVRITAQLVDATTGYHVWAERYDRNLKNIFALQDEVTQKIVGALAVKLTEAEQEHVLRKDTDNLEAYDYYLRGREYFFRFTKETMAQARQMFERAIDLDPEYAAAYVGLGLTYFNEWTWQWSQDPQSLERAFELAQRAIVLNDSLPMAHILMGKIYLWEKQHEQAIAELERAIALDPNDADAYVHLANILNFAGRSEEAIGLVKKAMRLNPLYSVRYLWSLGHAYLMTRQYEKAISAVKRALKQNPDFLPPHILLAIIYSELGREEEARDEAAEILRINPNFSLEVWRQRRPYKDQAQLERILNGLHRAGLK
jgi:adenylate cyclase